LAADTAVVTVQQAVQVVRVAAAVQTELLEALALQVKVLQVV
jgi:hypothetical protein